MTEYIACRSCESPDCKGCNLKRLETMLENGKFDCLMNENRAINISADVEPVKWLPIPNFEGLYEINTLSQIRNSSGEILKQQIRREKYTCYKVVSLWKDGRYYKKGVHRLMAETFLPNPDCLPVVNHKDEDGTNNLLSNLEWCSKSYNASYGTAPKKISRATKGKESEKRKPVLCYGMDGSFMSWYPSVTAAAKDVRGNTSNIAAVCNGERKTAYGYVWVYDCPNCGARMDEEAK